MYSYCHLI